MTSQGLIILSSIGIFLVIMIFLIAILLIAKKKLTPQGKVNLTINDDMILRVKPGSSLLTTLSENKIYLPSACGGVGTCGLCRCQILEGGGDILPTETGFFTRKEQHDSWRLGCQVKVRNDLKILVPKEIFDIKKMECEVVSNNSVATFVKEFVIKLPKGEKLNFKSGGYIQIEVPKIKVDYSDMVIPEKYKQDWDSLGIWNLKMKNPVDTYRAYSMANYPEEEDIIKLNIRIATPPWNPKKKAFKKINPGVCSSFLFSRVPGDKVTISGPFGNFFIKDTDREMIYIGGGVGMAPLRSHIMYLLKTVKSNRKISYWYGARSKREIFYEEEFRELEKQNPNFKLNIALSNPQKDDDWNGYVGFIHEVINDNYLSDIEEPEEIEYYLCGPPKMNDAVLNMLDDLGVPSEMIAFDSFT